MATKSNTAAKTSTPAGNGDAWKVAFGTLEGLTVKNGRKGPYAVLQIRGSGKGSDTVHTMMAFGKKVDEVVAAGIGASVWAKGPIEQIEKRNEAGRTYMADGPHKVVYFKNNSAEADAGETGAAEDQAPEAEASIDQDQAADMATEDMDDDIPF